MANSAGKFKNSVTLPKYVYLPLGTWNEIEELKWFHPGWSVSDVIANSVHHFAGVEELQRFNKDAALIKSEAPGP